MKQIGTILIVLLLAFTLQAQNKAQRYAVKSGYLKCKLTGNVTGTKEIWWDDFGDKYKELEQSSLETVIFGIKSKEKTHRLTIVDKEKIWTVDYLKREGNQSVIPYEMNPMYGKTEAEQEKIADDLLKSLGGKKLGKENVIGYQCDLISLLGSKVWNYKGLTLKMESDVMGIKANLLAEQFKPNKSIPASTFTPPSDIEYTNLNKTRQTRSNSGNNNQSANETRAQGLSGLAEAFSMAVEAQAEETETKMPKTKYPYDKFKKIMNNFEYDSYKKVMVMVLEGVYTASFVKGLSNNLTVMAASRQKEDYKDVFRGKIGLIKGRKYSYGKNNAEGESSSYIVLDLDKYDTYITLLSVPHKTEEEMLKILKLLDF